MKYRNTKTGTVINVKSEVKGKYWEKVDDSGAKAAGNAKAAGKGKKKSNKPTTEGENAGATPPDPEKSKAGD